MPLLYPESVDICVVTIDNVDEGDGTTSAGPVDVGARTEGGLFVLNELIDHLKPCLV